MHHGSVSEQWLLVSRRRRDRARTSVPPRAQSWTAHERSWRGSRAKAALRKPRYGVALQGACAPQPPRALTPRRAQIDAAALKVAALETMLAASTEATQAAAAQ